MYIYIYIIHLLQLKICRTLRHWNSSHFDTKTFHKIMKEISQAKKENATKFGCHLLNWPIFSLSLHRDNNVDLMTHCRNNDTGCGIKGALQCKVNTSNCSDNISEEKKLRRRIFTKIIGLLWISKAYNYSGSRQSLYNPCTTN